MGRGRGCSSRRGAGDQGGGHTPAYTADQFDISLAEVHEALSYYYAHFDEMREDRTGERDT